LEGNNRSFLEQLDRALQQPKWQLYFGRKSFIPSRPVRIGIQDKPLLRALQQPHEGNRQVDRQLRYVLEVPNSLDVRRDVPIDWQKRLFGSRCVKTEFYRMEVYAECTSPS
jgi:CRISPR system Cascade subunit CasD